jgi:hypothetical protein
VTDSERNDVEIAEMRANLKSLREIVDERDRRYEDRFKATDDRTGLALTSSKEAVGKAELATEKRFDSVNEFRGQLKDQAATLLPRAEADAKFNSMTKEIEELKKVINTSQGKSSGFMASWGVLVAAIMIGATIVGGIVGVASLLLRSVGK